MPLSEESELFLKYNYAETKDLCKHFLTVVTAVLVFSLTFSEKIVDYKNAIRIAKFLLLGSWALFFAAIIACGIGLVFISLAGGAAVYQGIPPQSPQALYAYKFIVAAGLSFMLGLLSLMATGFVAVLNKQPEPPRAKEKQVGSASIFLHQASRKGPGVLRGCVPRPGLKRTPDGAAYSPALAAAGHYY